LTGVVATLGFAAQASTLVGWNTDNVVVAPTPADGDTGASVVYDRDPMDPGATTSGQIVFTPPEAVSPGIKVQQESYSSGVALDGCIMTSNPGATCTSPFQSGKRVKQQMTGSNPVDLVFDVAAGSETSIYQMFGRLINVTGQALSGFDIELGFGTGADFVAATISDALRFSTDFTASPSGAGSSGTQFPFGLFGNAATNSNFVIDGFFADQRTGMDVIQTETKLSSDAFFGPYSTMFGPWMTQSDVPTGLFWDFDDDDTTDALLMAWEYAPGLWELRREAIETCDISNPAFCSPASTLASYVDGLTYAEVVALLGIDVSFLDVDGVEDLANLNLNYAIELGDLGAQTSFTLRTTVHEYQEPAPVPLPAGAPLLLAGLGALGFVKRRRRASKR